MLNQRFSIFNHYQTLLNQNKQERRLHLLLHLNPAFHVTFSINPLRQREKRVDLSRKIIYNSVSTEKKTFWSFRTRSHFSWKVYSWKVIFSFFMRQNKMIYRFLVKFFFCLLVEKISHKCKKSAWDLKNIPDESGKCCSIVRIQFASQGSRFFGRHFYLVRAHESWLPLLTFRYESSVWKATESWTFPTIENKLFNLWWSPQKTNGQLITFLFHWKALHNSRRRQLRTFAVCESINIAREWTWMIRQINYEINHATNCVTETIRTKWLLLCREGSRSSEFHSRIAFAFCQCMKNIAAWRTSLHGAHLVTQTWFLQWERPINGGKRMTADAGKGGLRDVPEHNGIWNSVKFTE